MPPTTKQNHNIDQRIVRAVRTNPVIVWLAVRVFAGMQAETVRRLVREQKRTGKDNSHAIQLKRDGLRRTWGMARAFKDIANEIGE